MFFTPGPCGVEQLVARRISAEVGVVQHMLHSAQQLAAPTHQVVVDRRHLVSTVMCDEHFVVGTEARAKHLIAKHISIPALCCQPQPMRSYTELQDCVHEFQNLLVRTENARVHSKNVACKVQTVGSQAFRLYQRFNTTSTSKITSAFPEHDV